MSACAAFKTMENGVEAQITFSSLTDKDVYHETSLFASCHLALIHTLNQIWPEWFDYDQYIAKLRSR